MSADRLKAVRSSDAKWSAVIAAAVVAASTEGATAAAVTWTGTTDTNFATGANWGGTAPQDNLTSDQGTFANAIPANQPVLFASRSINGLRMTTPTGGWALGSDSASHVLTVGGGGINTVGQTSGTNTINANIGVGATQTWASGAGGALTFNGILSGSSNLTIGSAGNTGVVTFTGASTYSGSTTVSFGTLVLAGSTGNAVKGAIGVSAGATLRLDGTSGDQVANDRNLTINGTLDLNGRSETINQLQSSTGVVTNNAAGTSTLWFNNGSVFGGTVQDGGAGRIVALKIGNQSLTLTGNNSYSGGTQLGGGTFVVGSNTAAGTGTIATTGAQTLRGNDTTERTLANLVTYVGGTITFGSAATGNLGFGALSGTGSQTFNVANARTTIAGAFAPNSGTYTKNGTGSLIFQGSYTHTAAPATGLTINAGSVAVAGAFSSTGTTKLAGGQLGRNGTLSANLNAANGVGWTNGVAGGLFAFGANGSWGDAANNLNANFGGSAAPITWNGTGTSFISSGQTLLLGNVLSNGTVTIDNPINLNAATQAIQVVQGTSNTAGGADARLNGILSNGGLTKSGDGTLLLAAANTYGAGTTVLDGTLVLANPSGSATGSGPVNISGGALATGSTGSASGIVSLAGGATIRPGASAAGVLTAGGLALSGGSQLELGQAGDLIDLLGSLSYTGASAVQVIVPAGLTENYTLIQFVSTTAALADFELAPGADPDYSLQLTANALVVVVPEPASVALIGGAVLLLAGRRRAKRS